MDGQRKDFFWPSYVDLMTALFAVTLVLFVLSFIHYKKQAIALKHIIEIKEKQNALLKKVQANLKLFKSAPEVFNYNEVYNRIELAFNIQFKTGYKYYRIDPQDIDGNFPATREKLNALGRKMKSIIDVFKKQKETDSTMKDISYLMVISGTASHLKEYGSHSPDSGRYANSLLSYNRALYLYKYLKDNLNIDFDSPEYHNIIELQISGMGFGGIGRYNVPYKPENYIDEEKNQRFIISIAPKIGIQK